MKAIFAILVCLAVAAGVCLVVGRERQPQVVAQWPQAKVGMTRRDIEALFGAPTVKRPPAEVKLSGDGDSPIPAAAAFGLGSLFSGPLEEYWEYAPNAPVLPHPNLGQMSEEERKRWFESLSPEDQKKVADAMWGSLFGPDPESFVVIFDSQGLVKRLESPSKGRYARFNSPGL